MINVDLKLDLSRSNAYFNEARRYSPGGAPDAKGWERDLFYIERAKGNRLWDLDGNEYIDYNAGAGPIILGHSADELDEVVIETIRNVGVQVAQPHTLEVELTKKLREIIPGAEQSVFCNAGTDTLQYAVRMARTYTGRQKVVKFEGGYHGWADGLAISTNPSLDAAGPGSSPNAIPDTSGVLPAILENTIVLPYNDLDAASERLEREKRDIACVIVEPIVHGHAILPRPGFLKGLQELCNSCDIPLVLDEIITGFRHDLGGLQKKWGIEADMACYGKSMANGYVISAVTGKQKYMSTLSPDGPAFFSGTYNGNPVSSAATLKTIEILGRDGFYERLYGLGDLLRDGINQVIERLAVNAVCYGYGSTWGIFFDRTPPSNYRDVAFHNEAGGSAKGAAYARHMLNHGIFIQPSRPARAYLYAAHTEADVQRTVDAAASFFTDHQTALR